MAPLCHERRARKMFRRLEAGTRADLDGAGSHEWSTKTPLPVLAKRQGQHQPRGTLVADALRGAGHQHVGSGSRGQEAVVWHGVRSGPRCRGGVLMIVKQFSGGPAPRA